jgi:hypothetical protein
MLMRVIVAGILGGLVMVLLAFVVNGLLRLRASIDLNQIANERQVYEVLKENVTEPGRYVLNPALTEARVYPPGEPVFSVLYGGTGHESAGRLAVMRLGLAFILPIIACGLLSQAKPAVLSSYPRKVLFFAALGLIISLSTNLPAYGIGGYPLDSTVILSVHDFAVWTVAGVVMAWALRPKPDEVPAGAGAAPPPESE